MSVLIVDDEEGLRESLKEFLEEEGYRVATATNGAEALALLEHDVLPCMMILDLIMPMVTGGEVYRQMQNDPRLAQIPVIISTSDPTRAPRGVLILRKPISLEQLLGAVRLHCGMHGPSRTTH